MSRWTAYATELSRHPFLPRIVPPLDDPALALYQPSSEFDAAARGLHGPQKVSPVEEGSSARYEESAFRWKWLNYDTSLGLGECVELARILVPEGCSGIVHTLQTFAALWVQLDETTRIPIPITALGGLWPALLDFLGDSALRWHLRIVSAPSVELREPGRVTRVAELPGIPHPELATWEDLRFTWAQTQRPVRLRVPEGHYVSLWCEFQKPLPDPTAPEDIGLPFKLDTVAHLFQIPLPKPAEVAEGTEPLAADKRIPFLWWAQMMGRIVVSTWDYNANPEAVDAARRGL